MGAGIQNGVSMKPVMEDMLFLRSRLSAERYRRGWSQQDVADFIGTTPLNVRRWERGVTTPRPYFCHKLTLVFGVSAQALGIVSDDGEMESSDTRPASQAQQAVYDPTLPLPMTMVPLIGREEELHYVRQHLLTPWGIPFAAINGLPGIGKTALALEIAYNQQVREQFTGGILWATLAPDTNLTKLFRHWGKLLGIPASEAKELVTPEAWINALKTCIGERRFLIVLDNVWHLQDAWYCLVGGPGCAYVITTCFPQISLAFAKERPLTLQELSEEESLRFITHLAPEVVEREPEQVSALIKAIGGLPLALILIGNYLRFRSHNGQPRRIRAALATLNDTQTRLQLTDTHLFSDRSPSAEPVSLETAIAAIDHRLDAAARQALRALSVFSPKPASFSEEAALEVCQLPVETLDMLSDAGLLESVPPGRYALHRVVSDYARLCPADK